ncbi:hypothetical protein C5E08_12315 [Rathayibacter iranicus]|uniref:RES domain-containing protein n=1 Tax=Rathayibacter iranicus TaxID=59737 RepID=A0AAD1AE89_9MICO|nr:hypothetical protein C7V51_12480 [Rathayibacter iranicus]MWV32397.1 RES domain-containing protein [Rathayibacter iranicus NCPPB 2253 = VKM Ac-1602]PPI43412.1 hypothetical protein C5E09_11400 [Rathayibacter iranicus]PPI58456.1 hypothetical protein C5E08_12315 [Rathayibacter iranicus]PPI69556.1 hypothetical protein C5E01_11360 [Rathayibacter iranicus]
MGRPHTVPAPDVLWRVGRATDPARFTTVDPIDASTSTAGNRFDVPGGAVLYAATEPSGAYAETISRLRPTSRMRALARALTPSGIRAARRDQTPLDDGEPSPGTPNLGHRTRSGRARAREISPASRAS